jgi:hypothetical protein
MACQVCDCVCVCVCVGGGVVQYVYSVSLTQINSLLIPGHGELLRASPGLSFAANEQGAFRSSCAVLYCTVLLYCTVPHGTVLYCTPLYCSVLYCTVLHCTILYCAVLFCTVLYCTALHCVCFSRLRKFPVLSEQRTLWVGKVRPARRIASCVRLVCLVGFCVVCVFMLGGYMIQSCKFSRTRSSSLNSPAPASLSQNLSEPCPGCRGPLAELFSSSDDTDFQFRNVFTFDFHNVRRVL